MRRAFRTGADSQKRVTDYALDFGQVVLRVEAKDEPDAGAGAPDILVHIPDDGLDQVLFLAGVSQRGQAVSAYPLLVRTPETGLSTNTPVH